MGSRLRELGTAPRVTAMVRGVAAAGVAIGLFLLLNGLADGSSTERGNADRAAREAPTIVRDASDVAALEARVQRVPEDWTAWASLGIAYVEAARSGGDATMYGRAESALERSRQIHPGDNALALTGMGVLEAARHRFDRALANAAAALDISPRSILAQGVRADALVQLGRYADGIEAANRMVDTRPIAPAYARVSYVAELHGDVQTARAAMELSHRTSSSDVQRSFALQHLGDLEWSVGRLDAAERQYLAVLRDDPTDTAAIFGMGRIAAARGDLEAASRRFAQAVALVPHPEQLAEYGDLLTVLGHDAQAREQYEAARAALQQMERDGFAPEAEGVLFEADHGTPEATLASARRLYALQRNIHTEDALAWALHRVGRNSEALRHARAATRLGAPYASMYYHRGVIESALGDTSAARRSLERALRLNPAFSIRHAPRAQRLLARLSAAA